jgi:hypothetical protein
VLPDPLRGGLARPERVRAQCAQPGKSGCRSLPFESIREIGLVGSSSVSVPGQVDWRSRALPPDFQPTGNWRSWSARRKDLFKRHAGEALVEVGYASDLDW